MVGPAPTIRTSPGARLTSRSSASRQRATARYGEALPPARFSMSQMISRRSAGIDGWTSASGRVL
jgi:hypothetical protein